ncbi:PRTRC genetic system protein B [Dysgonomonas sp. PFB1-18]|uniref:PRTRC system protein B n=1 Tax=unclassified Dysgonomonas TaxID=2630389 RepID=UPI00247372C7|nr:MULTISPECIES: PRTRC system protein B [unclassified Dysgonomonas]MDH6310929.1 PRTRC genetic system protein B [Dysgonomonas sp. PF1-14]MDH6340856.1 PRTRC genetic system protein B [Dysgonomonas sp. PF1-16]MDH6382452.1 PRTRC genetic system protein B [Dysgonomonas sp. PFB1-18]MDH6399801.1 PRTRC genetic system protein B [Dysgonomonas sp. PF1-23]
MSYTTYDYISYSEDVLVPRMALVVYGTLHGYTYLESHSIDENGRMLSGVPLSEKCISELVGSFSQEQISMPHGRVPANLLYFDNRIGQTRYVWYEPPKKQMMYFTESLNIPDGEYYIPGILYVVSNEHLDVYAFKGDKPKDKLFHAPFFNTTQGSVCLGSATLDYPENPSYPDFIAYWEKKFWLTTFTHLGGSQNPTKHNLVSVIKKSKTKFDMDELIPSTKTLNQLLS